MKWTVQPISWSFLSFPIYALITCHQYLLYQYLLYNEHEMRLLSWCKLLWLCRIPICIPETVNSSTTQHTSIQYHVWIYCLWIRKYLCSTFTQNVTFCEEHFCSSQNISQEQIFIFFRVTTGYGNILRAISGLELCSFVWVSRVCSC